MCVGERRGAADAGLVPSGNIPLVAASGQTRQERATNLTFWIGTAFLLRRKVGRAPAHP